VLDCFAVCAPGLEPLLRTELEARKVRGLHVERGGVGFRGTTRQLYDANAWLRTASRVLVRVARFRATSFAELEHQAAAIEWDAWIGAGCAVRLRVSSSASRLYHTDAIADRLRAVIGEPGGAEDREQLVVARVHRDAVTLSVDSSGEHLHRRGWRRASAKAPLRETLAAAMVLASGWTGDAALIDPFCGSGTIPIEAARFAAGLPPSPGRAYSFQRWPSFEPGTWASVRAGLQDAVTAPSRTAPIVAADRDAGAVRATEENARRAGVYDLLDIRNASFSDTLTAVSASASAGWVVANPPYGRRVRGGDLRDLYASLGRLAAGPLRGWHLGFLVADRVAAGHAGLSFDDRFVTTNGGIPVTFAMAVTD
jgi:putative N6-adenine-specific DNA methylase